MDRGALRRAGALGSALLLLLAPGCRGGLERAGEHRDAVRIGMTRAEVRAAIGSPDAVELDFSSLQERWSYSYGPGVAFDPQSLAQFAGILVGLAIMTAFLVGLAWLAQGNLGGLNGLPGGDFAGPSGGFALLFGPEGRVEGIRPLPAK